MRLIRIQLKTLYSIFSSFTKPSIGVYVGQTGIPS